MEGLFQGNTVCAVQCAIYQFNIYFSNMDLSSCLELRSSPCVASSAFLANGGGCGENNGEGIDKEEDDEVISQRPGINLVRCQP